MALSNMLREPRREITETVVGLSIFAIPIYLDYRAAGWLEWATRDAKEGACPWPLGMLLMSIAIGLGGVLTLLLLVLVHGTGNAACNALQRNNIHLRPRVRPPGVN